MTIVVVKTDRWEVYVAAKVWRVYPEPVCFQETPAPYLRASIALGPTRAHRASKIATYGHLDTTSMEAA